MFLLLLILIFGLLGGYFFGIGGVIISTLFWLWLFLVYFKHKPSKKRIKKEQGK